MLHRRGCIGIQINVSVRNLEDGYHYVSRREFCAVGFLFSKFSKQDRGGTAWMPLFSKFLTAWMLAKILFLTFFSQREKNVPPPFEHLMKIFFRNDRRECRKKIILIKKSGGKPCGEGGGTILRRPCPAYFHVVVCSQSSLRFSKLFFCLYVGWVGCRGFLRIFLFVLLWELRNKKAFCLILLIWIMSLRITP